MQDMVEGPLRPKPKRKGGRAEMSEKFREKGGEICLPAAE